MNKSTAALPKAWRFLNYIYLLMGLLALAGGIWVAFEVQLKMTGGEGSSEREARAPLGSGLMFDAVAKHYDRMNKLMSLGLDQSWRWFLIEGLELQEGDKVLDLATGTADVAVLAAEAFLARNWTGGQVWGIDPSAGMLRIGEEKIAAKGLGSVVRLTLGDAQAMGEVASDSVDKISMSFGIRNVEDRLSALKEMARVLKKSPASRVGILEFQLPQAGPLRWVAEFMVRRGARADAEKGRRGG
ncbi:ubiquinone menaquinone biosynthesis methyltransferase [Nannochloropsis gaditana]|uniref:Ubiquinone menaquinone biosynthesis methyltransferase n=1 Tax=Nannochloropsis gaditana TaxID=72520 RepID=W7TJU2_9STRA|nr:ubiquinone menaquinone biosynthesis methyltransferase [Nannochloropsis gaditana]